MRNENYLVIQGFMINELNLKGNELLAFALIYGFCQDEETEFTGSLSYISEWLNVSRPTTIKVLDELIAKNYIIKKSVVINGVKFNRYKINLQVVKKLYQGSKETLLGGSKKTLPNNINNNINDNIVYKEEYKEESVQMYGKCTEGKVKDNALDNISNEELKSTLNDFIEMRKKIKKPLTKRALELALKELDKLAKNDNDKIAILNQSILNCWQGLFPLKEKEYKNERIKRNNNEDDDYQFPTER